MRSSGRRRRDSQAAFWWDEALDGAGEYKEKSFSVRGVLLQDFFRWDERPRFVEPCVPLILGIPTARILDFELRPDDVSFPTTEQRLWIKLALGGKKIESGNAASALSLVALHVYPGIDREGRYRRVTGPPCAISGKQPACEA